MSMGQRLQSFVPSKKDGTGTRSQSLCAVNPFSEHEAFDHPVASSFLSALLFVFLFLLYGLNYKLYKFLMRWVS